MIGMKTAAVAVFDVTSVRNTTTVATKKDENVYWNARNTGHDLCDSCVEPALLKPVRQ